MLFRSLKYLKKFDSKTNYQESLFFNMKKVLSLLEKNLGDKLMIDFDAKNMISFLLFGKHASKLMLRKRVNYIIVVIVISHIILV